MQRGKRLEALKKSELEMFSKYLELEVKIGMLKIEFRNVIATDWVDEEILDFGKYKKKKR
jgi:hypothetical protein